MQQQKEQPNMCQKILDFCTWYMLYAMRMDNYVHQQPTNKNNNNNKWKIDRNKKYYTDFNTWSSKQRKGTTVNTWNIGRQNYLHN
jgi:hypothetical protein